MTRHYTINPDCIKIKYGGLSLKQLSEKLNINIETVKKRHQRGKWSEDEMLEGKKKRGYKIRHHDREATLSEWAEETGISINVLRTRLRDYYDTNDILK